MAYIIHDLSGSKCTETRNNLELEQHLCPPKSLLPPRRALGTGGPHHSERTIMETHSWLTHGAKILELPPGAPCFKVNSINISENFLCTGHSVQGS